LDGSSRTTEKPLAFTPCLHLHTERMWVSAGDGLFDEGREELVPVITLTFDYAGVKVRAADRRTRFFVAEGDGVGVVGRDLAGEARAQCLLESFGAIELDCSEHAVAGPDPDADYLVQFDGDVHAYCSFGAVALPQLRALGWVITVDASYPYQVVESDSPWYAAVEPDAERTDWFGLELGIEIEGRRVNLLPALLEMLETRGDTESLETLLDVTTKLRAVAVGENRYVTIPPARLRFVLKVLLELYRGEELADGTLRFPRTGAASVAKLDQALGESARLLWSGMTDAIERARGFVKETRGKPAAPSVPLGLCATLRPYQEEGVAWLAGLVEHEAGGVLADDMGLGKTLQTITHVLREKQSGRAEHPTLIVMPTSLVGNWRREFKKFAPALEVVAFHGPKRVSSGLATADVVLTSYPLLVRDLELLKNQPYHLVILDEAQAVKNPRSLAARAVRELNARHRLCLSGTPIENNLEELWSLFDFLMPGFLGDADSFRTQFRVPIERMGNQLRLEALRSAVAPFVLRRMKESVARDLPPKTEIVRPVDLGGEQRELYESIRVAAHGDVRRAIKEKGVQGATIAILDALMKLRQVCCDPRLVTVPSARRVKESAKFDLFFELLATQLGQGRRVLVFSQFTRMLDLLAAGLDERKLPFVELTGATQDRQRAVDRFEGREVDVFLISLKAGGTGLNLTSADTVVHYDPWWNAASQAQATDRAYRIGQTRPVFVYNLIATGSVEERMLQLQQKKSELARSLLGGSAIKTPLSELEVDDLFAPLGE
jgi:superfamily II DNA or RNA helicase